MTKRVLAIGECMVELAPQAVGGFAMGFAGDTFNTAWYLRHRLPVDWDVAYLTGVGTDALSAQMTEFIVNAGITPEFMIIPDRTVGLYLISLTNGERSFSYWRSAAAARKLAQHRAPIDALERGDIAYFSGITVAILDPEDRAQLLGALAAARARGVKIAFDPNLRPRLWSHIGDMRDWIMRAARVADIALPSFEDEANVFGDADKAATLTRYKSAGAHCVIVKDGPGDVLAQDGDQPEVVVSPVLNPAPVDTTAAGDSFNAAFLAGYLRGDPLHSAIAAGCALSHHVVSHKGALVQMP